MNRRDFIALIGGAAGLPLPASAQKPPLPVIGFLSSGVRARVAELLPDFQRGLTDGGFVEGQNLAIEYRWADGRNDRLPALAAELVRRKVALIVSSGGDVSALAAKAATTTIPIVFVTATDPVESGLVASLNRPGGNITGVSRLGAELLPKKVQLLQEVVPAAAEIGVFVNQTNISSGAYVGEVEAAAHSLGRATKVFKASSDDEIEAAFAAMTQLKIAALLIANDPFFSSRSQKLAALTLSHALPATYSRDFVIAGGLMSYGTSLAQDYHQLGVYAARILKGDKPADLPVEQQSQIEFVLNLKTARALGLTIPLPLIGRADEVIE